MNYTKDIDKTNFIKKNIVDIYNYSPQNNKKLVHYSGMVETKDVLQDESLTVNTPVLTRKVEMYQWKRLRNRSNSRSGRNKFTKIWSDKELDPNSLGHYNTPMTIKDAEFRAANVTIEDFILDKSIINKLKPSSRVYKLPPRDGYQIVDNYYFSGKDFKNPKVGDYRISYKYLPVNTEISVIAAQYNNLLYEFKNNNYSIILVSNGRISTYEMLKNFKDNAALLAIFIRILCFIFLASGLYLIKEKLSNILSCLPMFDNRQIKNIPIFFILLLTLAISMLITAVTSITVRTITSLLTLAAAVFIIFIVLQFLKKKQL